VGVLLNNEVLMVFSCLGYVASQTDWTGNHTVTRKMPPGWATSGRDSERPDVYKFPLQLM
ncbi:hypothetical protein ACV2DB_22930, partial [Salmonella enterica subsp. diarizonae serovar 61:c:z35]